jgi:hypothetical protein
MVNKTRPVIKCIACASAFSVVLAFDYFTGYEVTSYPVYLFPILLTFFYFGKWGGYLACLVSTVFWIATDISTGHYFSNELFRYWAGASRLGIYLVFVYGLSIYTKTVATHRRRLEEMRRLVPMCHGCGKILWRDGMWKTPQEVLALTRPASPECPDCEANAS